MTDYPLNTMNTAIPAETSRRRTLLIVIAVLVWVVGAGVIGYLVGMNRTGAPGLNSPEAGFAHDMMTHHTNAVEMALILRDQTQDEAMRNLALDIAMTQQNQIGQMLGWLAVWNLPASASEPAMTWMGMPQEGLMPGMATQEQLQQLSQLEGVEADKEFLTLMISHHRSGVDMAKAILTMTSRPEIVSLAEGIVLSQESEIKVMEDLLTAKGGEVSEEEGHSMEGMDH
jgi:uncharacterized protein (DUF305 family)